jgi:hypothetical protein
LYAEITLAFEDDGPNIIIKSNGKISFFTMSEKENPWSEDETDTCTTTEANEPIEVDDDVSHEAQRVSDDYATGLLFLPDYVRGMKQKLRTSRNKISMQIPVTGARCTIVWAIHDSNAPYWCPHTCSSNDNRCTKTCYNSNRDHFGPRHHCIVALKFDMAH